MVQYQTAPLAFAAISDPTRRGILERLGRGNASISELADAFAMTLTGVKKHVRVLEEAGLVATRKEGRVRTCRLGPSTLDAETAWIAEYRRMVEGRSRAWSNPERCGSTGRSDPGRANYCR